MERHARDAASELAIVGLGQIGGNIVREALEAGFRVVGQTRAEPPGKLVRRGVVPLDGADGLRAALRPPCLVILRVPAGSVVDLVLEEVAATLEPGDVVAAGGKSYRGASIRHHAMPDQRGIGLADLGTSGGPPGARRGGCFMAGGEQAAVARLEPVCRALTEKDGVVHAGGPGAGPLVKLVHNRTEFGMMQAIAERWAPLDLQGVVECWRRGSVIRSWLVDLPAEAHTADPGLAREGGFVEDNGEVNWLLMDAMRMEVPLPAIAQSVMQFFLSRERPADRVWARGVIAMRHGFGDHSFGADNAMAHERREVRVGSTYRADRDG